MSTEKKIISPPTGTSVHDGQRAHNSFSGAGALTGGAGMKTYKITIYSDAAGCQMIITERDTGAELAEYRLTPGGERSETSRMRYVIDRHLASGGTLGNYQW